MFSSSPLWIGDMRKTPCVKIKPVQSRIFHLLQLDKVELRNCLKNHIRARRRIISHAMVAYTMASLFSLAIARRLTALIAYRVSHALIIDAAGAIEAVVHDGQHRIACALEYWLQRMQFVIGERLQQVVNTALASPR